MALDPEVSDGIKALILAGSKHQSELVGMASTNLAQGLGVINNTLIQQHGGVADDAAQFGAMNTAAGVPQSGFVKGA
jgi:hypothetical protein